MFKVQKEISKLLHSAACARLEATGSIKDAVRLSACREATAWLWQTVIPVEDALELTDSEMRSALRHQYGLSPLVSEWYCKCGASVGAGHFHSCNRVSGPATYSRHEAIVSDLSALGVGQLMMNVAKAPAMSVADGSIVLEEDGARQQIVPDVVFDGAGLTLAIDVTVCYSETASNLPSERARADKKVVDALAKRAQAKAQKYGASCAEQGVEFLPFVLESHGGLHDSAVSVLTRLAKYGANVIGCREGELLGYMKRRVAIALQRGNAKLDRMALTKSRNSYGAAVARGLVVPRDGDEAQGGGRRAGSTGRGSSATRGGRAGQRRGAVRNLLASRTASVGSLLSC